MTPTAAALAVLIILAAFGLMTAAFLLLRGASRAETLGLAAGVGCFLTGFAIQGLLPGLHGKTPGARLVLPDEAALYGEEIYVREGCAICHTQCRLPDEEGWPLRPEDRAWSRTGLTGVRRLGPDLSRFGAEAGARAGREPLARQLAERHSIMPSYARLFIRAPTADGGTRWEPNREAAALIDYLQRLGRPGWAVPGATATPAAPTPTGPPAIPAPPGASPSAASEPGGRLTEDEQWFLSAKHDAENFSNTPAGRLLRNQPDDYVRQYLDAFFAHPMDYQVPQRYRAMFKDAFFQAIRGWPTPTPRPASPRPSIPPSLPTSPSPAASPSAPPPPPPPPPTRGGD